MRGPPERADVQISPKAKPKQTALQRLASRSTREVPKVASRTPRSREEVEEDAYIAYIEAKLGYSKGKQRSKEDEVDGLSGGYMSLQYLVVDITRCVLRFARLCE